MLFRLLFEASLFGNQMLNWTWNFITSGCTHAKWRTFDIGFDGGWCCSICKREMDYSRPPEWVIIDNEGNQS